MEAPAPRRPSSNERAPTPARRVLLGAHYSPWTERARWALDHHGIRYRFEEHVPVLGEPALRLRLGRSRRGSATVPVLFDGDRVVPDSLEIVLHADGIGGGDPLVGDPDATRRFFARVDRALVALRGRVLASILDDPEAQRDSVVGVPKAWAAWMRPAVRASTRYMARKYGVVGPSRAEFEPEIRAMLLELREAVDGGSLAIDRFGAEHLAAATFLQGVRPVRAEHIPLSDALRRAWTCESLAEEFADVLAWRDRVYGERRFPAGA